MPVQDRREQLQDAALQVLLREGYARLNVDAIAREAGVTRPVVYSAYGGLAPLLDALLDRTQQRALTTMVTLMGKAPDDDLDGWLVHLVSGLLEAARTEPEVWRPVLDLVHGTPENVRERIEETRELIRSTLEQRLADGLRDRGTPDVEPEVLSQVLLVAGEQFARLVITDPDRYPPERLVANLRGVLASIHASGAVSTSA
ncbi:TetR/AcrR family transcriptional regulator [Flexivirga meconopsidis]|uniref:TetR/AcrR family transcriptional regulator n=1 Tax=Flexivirga meconopsidis TaxID=2977121 RepID=UPI0022400FC6|nr:TetR/AcrR family transcriptional regulator [Flexivirga meconopsidis]